MTGPSRTWRRSGSSGTVASSRAGNVVRSSVGVGACRTSGRSGPASAPSPGSAQVARQTVRARSSTARPASSADGTSPSARTTCHRRAPTRTVSPSSVASHDPVGQVDRRQRGQGEQEVGRLRPPRRPRGRRRRDRRAAAAGPPCRRPAGAPPRRVRWATPAAGPAPPRRVAPARRRGPAAPVSATARAVRARSKTTPPVRVTTRGASLIAVTAAKPTPKRPTPPDPRLADARSEARPATPSASSGAPAFATCRTPSTARTRRVVVIPARSAASAAFCASSTNHRSR